MNKEKFNISKLSVDNKDKTLYAEYAKASVTKGGILNTGETAQGDQPVKKELLDILQLMVPHLLTICQVPGHKNYSAEYFNKKHALTDEKIQGYFVSGFSVSNKGLISIVGGIKTDSGRVTSMVAPITSLDLETSPYTFVKNLNVLVESGFELAYQYFTDGSFGEKEPNLFDGKEDKQKEEVKA